jgi:hypothetical protein
MRYFSVPILSFCADCFVFQLASSFGIIAMTQQFFVFPSIAKQAMSRDIACGAGSSASVGGKFKAVLHLFTVYNEEVGNEMNAIRSWERIVLR